ETGIDVGLKVFLVTADGVAIEHPHHYRRGEKRLAKAQQRLSRRKKGRKRREKARGQVAKRHQKVHPQRRDSHHKPAPALVRQYDGLYLEDLRVANLVRSRHLAKSISDAGWGSCAPSLPTKQHTLVSKSSWWNPPTPARTAATAGRASRRASR